MSHQAAQREPSENSEIPPVPKAACCCGIRKRRYDGGEGNPMATTETEIAIDWTTCELIEQVPGKVSGRPVVRGTRILPDAIAGSFDLGETLEELHEGFPTLTRAQIERLIEFAHR